ncbi:hypothetical protein PYS61_01770 [Amygdalobacter indicium]|jgi:hypothetical protein|uniref:Uncharacterized protein n=1 Tax=Amygdalobacter indicium TaxID=3029272 RepID=A0ABY8C5E9_9FIRM|nr:hypothetical protein [Amygdalobacter indicium]WEG34337.1 hypothetical protein PYS60_06520 [Amygdalobacter indicium]WEG35921.1 hypothetical protein PYS61_01770 [Amygdalobacter indicium]
MKKIVSLVLMILVLFSQSANFLQAQDSSNLLQLRDLPEYIWEYEEDASKAEIVEEVDYLGPSRGISIPGGGSVIINTDLISDKTVDVSFSLSFGLASASVTLPLAEYARNRYVGSSVNIPSDGFYVIKVKSWTKVTPIIAKRKLLGSNDWYDDYIYSTKCEVLSLEFDTERVD